MKVEVVNIFRDKFTSKLYSVGEVLYIEDETRVSDLVERNLIEVIGGEQSVEEKKAPKGITLFENEFEKKVLVEALKTIGSKATGNMGEATLLGIVAELDEEALTKLKEGLGIEA